MEKVTLGRSGLKVSPICLGTSELGGEWGAFDNRVATAAIRRARDLGINFFDTAQGYGFGRSEELLGVALAEDLRTARDEVVIATKGGLRPVAGGLVRDSSPEWLRKGVDASLQALGVDVIDLYQVHWPDPNTPFEETANTLAELVEVGKVRHAGVSNFDAEQMRDFAEHGPLETLQPPYDMFRRGVEDSVLPYCHSHDVGVLIYAPLAHGLLGGELSMSTTFASDDWRRRSRDFAGETFDHNLMVVEDLKQLASDRELSLSTLALAWTLANPAVDVAIVGERGSNHLQANVTAADVRLSHKDLAAIERILERAKPMQGPAPEGMRSEIDRVIRVPTSSSPPTSQRL